MLKKNRIYLLITAPCPLLPAPYKKNTYVLLIALFLALCSCSKKKIIFVGIKEPEQTKTGTLTINTAPWGDVYIDGEKIDQDGSQTPIIKYQIPVGSHLIEVRRKGFNPYNENIEVSEGTHSYYSARMPILFNKDNFDFELIHGVEDIDTMNNIALIIGPQILEEIYYQDIIDNIKEFGEFDTVLLFDYGEIGASLKNTDRLENNMKKLVKFNNNLRISYFDRYLTGNRELNELKNIMRPYERKKVADYKGACMFFYPIYGGENIETMHNVAIIVGPEILEDILYMDIIKYVRGFGKFDTILLYSYPRSETETKIVTGLRSNIDDLLTSSNNIKISYFNRYMITEKEIEDLKRLMEPYEKKGLAEHKGSCKFE